MDHSDPWGFHKILSSHENYIRFHSLIRAKYIFFQSRKVSRIKINTLSTFSCAWHPVTSSKISSLRSGSLFNFESPWLWISSLTSEKLKQYQHHHAFNILHNQSFRNNLFVSTKNQSNTTRQLKTSFLQSNWLVTFTNILCTLASQYKYAKNNVQIRGID